MARLSSPAPGRMVGSTTRGLLPVGLVLILLIGVPTVEAAQYEGPGHRGEVPVGDGGALAEFAPDLGEGVTHVGLSGIAPNICQIELDEASAAGNATLVWSPGNETAFVAAELGAREVPFRVASHWERDLNDACTVEVTENGRTWHDPRGRPFIDLQFPERMVSHEITAGNWTRVQAEVHNNGTLPERVNVGLKQMRDHWEIQNATPFLNVAIDPLETVEFGFDLLIPDDEPGRTNLLQLEVKGEESGSKGTITLVLEVESSGIATNKQEEDSPQRIDQRGRAPPDEVAGQSGQIPSVSPLVGLVVVAFVVVVKRRFSR